MIDERLVKVGGWFRYPTPGGEGETTTMVVEILKPTRPFPKGRVRHESHDIGRGATDTMEVFCENAKLLRDP